MELLHRRYFVTVAEEEYFSRAAEKLHIFQPALSMQIRSLEEELGAPLYNRTSRKVSLMAAGELFLPEAKRTLSQAARAVEIVQRSARGEIGSVGVGFSGNASFVGKLSGDLRGFHHRFPEVKIEMREASPQQQVDAILTGELDIGYCPTLYSDLPADLCAERIGMWPWAVAMSSKHTLARNGVVRKADLLDETS